MAWLSIKSLVTLLLVAVLLCCSCFGSSGANGISCDRGASGCGHVHLGSRHLNHHSKPSRKLKPISSPKPTPSPSPQPPPPPPPPPSSPSAQSPKPPSKPSGKPSPSPSPSPSPNPKTQPSPPSATTFDVRNYGAKGDGSTDDTKAFLAAWVDACKVASSTVVVPSKFQFLVGPISFAGPNCKPNIVFQLDGTIVAPTSAGAWGSGLLQWLEFTKLKGITVRGQGTIEGHGSPWWTSQTQLHDDPLAAALSGLPRIKPTALRFYGSTNVVVTGITIQNSPKAHLKFDSCQGVEVSKVTISSPGDSPNTDGIHLQNSVGVTIHDSNLACGDDCVSIQTGCSNVYIHDVSCGPGHGISIGGLGSGNTQAFVSNVTVQNVNMVGTMTAVRIKTWQGGSGAVSNIRFSNVKVSQVQTPIVIDQFYCDAAKCKNQTSAVALSDITYQGVAGTYTVRPVYLACSDSKPCTNLHLNNIQLQLQKGTHPAFGPFCWQAFGDLQPPTQPLIDCLMNSTS